MSSAASAASFSGGSSSSDNHHHHHHGHSHSTTPPEDLAEIGHAIFTALPPGSVSTSFPCSFLSWNSKDVIIVKSNRMEVRSYSHLGDDDDDDDGNATRDRFPLLLTLPINGRIVAIAPIRFPSRGTASTTDKNRDCILFATEKGSYALISYDDESSLSLANRHPHSHPASNQAGVEKFGGASSSSSNRADITAAIGEHYPVITHASGNFQNYSDHVLSGGRQCECGPLLSVDPLSRCVAMHLYDGYLTVLPINRGYDPFEKGRKRAPWGKNNSGIGGGGAAAATSGGEAASGAGGGERVVLRRGLSAGPFREAMHLRLEERTILSMTFLEPQRRKGVDEKYMPQLAILHQDCYGYQHVVSHGIDLQRKKLVALGANMDGKLLSSSGARGGRVSRGKIGNEDEDGWEDDDGGGKPAAVAPTMPPPGEQLKISKIEGGSGCLIAVPPPWPSPQSQLGKGQDLGGVLVLGQLLVTYHSTAENVTLRSHTGGILLLSWCRVDDDFDHSCCRNYNGLEDRDKTEGSAMRYLVGDERGRIHLLSLIRNKDGSSRTLLFDTLGTVTTASSLVYLGKGRVFVGSSFGNSQLVKILDDPVEVGTVNGGLLAGDGNTSEVPLADTTFVEVLEEYDNLGPIVDFDLRPCIDDNLDVDSPSKVGGKYRQSFVVTCSGVSKDGTVRLVRNGVGMREHASVEIEGIKGMWSLRRRFHDDDDTFLVQSFVRETRILGVQSAKDVEMEDGEKGGSTMEEKEEEEDEEEEGGALAEVTIPGFSSSKSTLFSGNMLAGKFDLLLQVVDDSVRVVDSESLALVAQWSPFSTDNEDSDDDEPMGFITVASANESGQIVVALRGGILVYLFVEEGNSSTPSIRRVRKTILEREISCMDLSPFGSPSSSNKDTDVMDIDNVQSSRHVIKSSLVAVGLWDDFSVRLLNLKDDPSLALEQVLHIHLGHGIGGRGASNYPAKDAESDDQFGSGGQHLMARSLCLVTMNSQSNNCTFTNTKSMLPSSSQSNNLDMILIGLGDGKLISFVLNQSGPSSNSWFIHSRKEVSLGTQGLHLIPFQHGSSKLSGKCVLATGDRPTVVYLTGGNAGSNSNPKLNYSTVSLTVDDDENSGRASHRNISVNVATPFRSSLLFSAGNAHCSSLCMADENTLRLGMIDNIEKLHVTTFKLGMTPRRIAYHSVGRVYCVGCIADLELGGEANQNNCVRFFDDSTFEELNCIRLEPFEMILTIESVSLGINSPLSSTKSSSTPLEYRPFIVMGTVYAYPDEDEPSQGRVLVLECNCVSSGDSQDQTLRQVRQVADLPLMGGIYSIAPFYDGNILVTCGSDTILCQLCMSAPPQENGGKQAELLLNHIGSGHHGHLISLFVKSLVSADKSLQRRKEKKQRAIVGDLMRSISLVEYYPKHQVIEEVASDFNSNFCTEVIMLTENIFMGSEGHNNLFVLQYNSNATTEQARIRLDTVGQYHLGENVNKMIGGSLIMPSSVPKSNIDATLSDIVPSDKSVISLGNKIDITIGSQTLYGTVDGTIGSVLGLGGKTFAFMSALQRAMDAIVRPVGDLSHAHYRAWQQDHNKHRACGFVDGDWTETFLDLNRPTMERVVKEMNIDPKWNIRDNGKGFNGGNDNRHNLMDTSEGVRADPSPPSAHVLSVEDVLCAVEELSMLH